MTKKLKSEAISVRVVPDVKQKLEDTSIRTGIPISWFVSALVLRHLQGLEDGLFNGEFVSPAKKRKAK